MKPGRFLLIGVGLYAVCFLLPIWTLYHGQVLVHYGSLKIALFLSTCVSVAMAFRKKQPVYVTLMCLILLAGLAEEMDHFMTAYGLFRALALIIALISSVKWLLRLLRQRKPVMPKVAQG